MGKGIRARDAGRNGPAVRAPSRPCAIRAVLFDFDGTLTRPGVIDFEGIRRAIACPRGTPILEYIESLPAAAAAPAWRILERFEREAARRATPNDGAETLLAALKRRRVRRGILTRNSRASVVAALRNFRRARVADFAVVIARDHLRRQKPHPEGVLLAARRLGLPPPALLVVGDYLFDVEAGRRAGAQTAFLESRLTTVRPDPPADFTIRALADVAAIVEESRA